MSKLWTMLKPPEGTPDGTPIWVDERESTGAYYYVYGDPGSVSKYKKVSATIILPTSIRMKGTGTGRNGYISFGMGTNANGVDVGIRNVGEHEDALDAGLGWEPYCIEVDRKTHTYEDKRAPAGTAKAYVEVEPLTSQKVELTVKWLSASNSVLSAHTIEIELDGTYTWDCFYRFASLVADNPSLPCSDSTYMLGGGFDAVKIGNYSWGIPTSKAYKGWILRHPKCQLPYGSWSTGEEFRIDHWA